MDHSIIILMASDAINLMSHGHGHAAGMCPLHSTPDHQSSLNETVIHH